MTVLGASASQAAMVSAMTITISSEEKMGTKRHGTMYAERRA